MTNQIPQKPKAAMRQLKKAAVEIIAVGIVHLRKEQG
jgi:hypothetical protein